MKIVITGSAGFIGSNATEACLRKGWTVLGIDNFATGHEEMSNPERVKGLGGEYSFVKMDVNETEKLAEVMQGYDVCLHFAAKPRVSYSVEFPIESNRANADGTLSVLEAAKRSGIQRVVFSCSSSIYGGVNEWPTPETSYMRPVSPYALQKVAGAEYVRLFSELYGLDGVSLTFFNVFGIYQRTGGSYSTCIPAFMECAIQGKPCIIHGDGLQSRDFTYVSDIIDANLLAAECSKPLGGERINIACGETHSVLEVYEKINALCGGWLTKTHAPRRLGDPMKSLADISKAREILGYEPKVSFDDGLKLTMDWWRGGNSIVVKK